MRPTRRSLVLAAVFLLAACGGAEPGSQEDLRAEVDAIDLPAGVEELGQSYTPSCPGTCPSFVVWYRVTMPPEEVQAGLVDAVTEAGWDVNEASASSSLYAARKDDRTLFVVMNQEMIDRNPSAPGGTNLEISVNVMDAPAG